MLFTEFQTYSIVFALNTYMSIYGTKDRLWLNLIIAFTIRFNRFFLSSIISPPCETVRFNPDLNSFSLNKFGQNNSGGMGTDWMKFLDYIYYNYNLIRNA